jgi:AAHS family 4-hydroxybenzoate transporter-like MFS transporter
MKTVDVGQVLDEGRWTAYQKLLIAGTALTIILDGVDNQLLPNAQREIAAEWHIQTANLANALAAGPFGMMIGGVLGGWLGDKIGRRAALLGSAFIFGLLTIGIAFINDAQTLLILRLLAGIGLGGAMPNAAALASEYVPRRSRPFAVTLTIVCIPLGGFVAAWLAETIIGPYGWRNLFVVGGLIPIALSVLLFLILPESPRFLARDRARWPSLRALLHKMGHDVPADAEFIDSASLQAGTKTTGSIGDLFRPAFRWDTIGLFGAFFFCLMANYIGFQRLRPLTEQVIGFASPFGNRALQYLNLGGVAGAILGALIIQRLGSRITMLGLSALSVVVALLMAIHVPMPSDVFMALVMFAIIGALLNAVQTTMYALAAHVYPVEIRGTGVGTAVAVGRIGNVLAVYVADYSIRVAGAPGYFMSWVVTMALVLVSLALVRRHIGRSEQEPVLATH